ncbi:hypothetical protein N8I77_001315 [Diaporthe amygdali]|uniref:Uncharacterized protein n=1 Tax=Phomopsis amygdali TaxID=1214568 RepID=A0AAD9SSM3_PHOAM|nr:hypothetical protein N8I77_001315 [Diaporthe amygdali]
MKPSNMMSILIFLVATVAVGLDIDPQSASVALQHLSVTFAPNALATLQAHGLWTPSAAGLDGLEPMFDQSFNATLEKEKFEESGLDINSLVNLGFTDDKSKNVTSMAIADVCAP